MAYMADPKNPKYQTSSPHPVPLRNQRDWSKTPPETSPPVAPSGAPSRLAVDADAAAAAGDLDATRVPDSSVTIAGAKKRGFLGREPLPSADVKFW